MKSQQKPSEETEGFQANLSKIRFDNSELCGLPGYGNAFFELWLRVVNCRFYVIFGKFDRLSI
jgi:hypothetical protein